MLTFVTLMSLIYIDVFRFSDILDKGGYLVILTLKCVSWTFSLQLSERRYVVEAKQLKIDHCMKNMLFLPAVSPLY